ncbi:hypothetical protein ACFWZ7_24770 [Nocardiopsis alba]|uniref:hypothetical protein n=1 Tax=Nocardiopsis alba TaxID=53437 RepID=UPI00366F4778
MAWLLRMRELWGRPVMLIDLIALAAAVLWISVTVVLLRTTDHTEEHPLVRPHPTRPDRSAPKEGHR